jgi:hypothetical protein
MKLKPPTVFWGNERVSYEALIGELRAATLERMGRTERVLLVQDTTSLDFSGHQATEGLGMLDNPSRRGLFVHTTLAVSSDGLPLGVVAQHTWTRPIEARGKAAKRHETAFEAKESYKWVDGLQDKTTGNVWANGLVICDREAHIYDFLDKLFRPDNPQDFIIRGASGRSFTPEGLELFEATAFQPVVAELTIQLKRRPEREARPATLQLRFGTVSIQRPKRSKATHPTLTVQVVEVIEANPPPGEEAVHWLLLTSLAVQSVADAKQIITWYTYRWLIERFHYTLKSGCKLEDSQLRQANRLERLLAVYSGVAWKLLWLTYQARLTPDEPATLILLPHEWQALYAFIKHARMPPKTPPTIRQAVRWIGQLGGFLGRKGDGEPGVKVLWRGWSRLQDIAHTWAVLQPKDVGNA